MTVSHTTTQPLRDYQRVAVDAVVGCERGLSVLACGTGKTRVAAAAALPGSSTGRRVVVFVPTLALLEQTLQAWLAVVPNGFAALGVCSQAVRGSEDIDVSELSVASTTDPAQVAEWVAAQAGRDVVVFATYQSAPVIAAAHTEFGLPVWSTMVCDEAHRIAGPRSKAFGVVLDDARIPAERRLFYTATPRIHASGADTDLVEVSSSATVSSMDNPALFGERAFTLSTREAIDAGWLSDYRLAVIAVTDTEIQATLAHLDTVTVGEHAVSAHDAATIIALHKAVDDYQLRSVLVFHNTIAASRTFTTAVEHLHEALGPARPVSAIHVDGGDSLATRRAALDTLHTPPQGGWSLVSNARCFSEGIDVPALDAVVFAQARTSPIDVAQAVGRAIRRNPDRSEPSLIILAVIVDTHADPEHAIEDSEFVKTRRVIAALEDHDPTLATDLAHLRHHTTTDTDSRSDPGDDVDTGSGLHVEIRGTTPNRQHLLDDYLTAFTTRLLPPSNTQRWEQHFTELQQYAAEHGHAQPPQQTLLGRWVSSQKTAYREGRLDDSRVRRLEALPGWAWSVRDAQWEEHFTELQQYATENGHLRPPFETALGTWVYNQRALYRDGRLDDSRVRRLEALPGWVWSVLDAQWEDRFTELQQYAEEHGHARPPAKTPLGGWARNQKRSYTAGRLADSRAQQLQAVPGWTWNTRKSYDEE